MRAATIVVFLVVIAIARGDVFRKWTDPESPDFRKITIPHPLEESFHRNTRGTSCSTCTCPSKFAPLIYNETVGAIDPSWKAAIAYTTCLISCYIPDHPDGGIRLEVESKTNPFSTLLASAIGWARAYSGSGGVRFFVPCALLVPNGGCDSTYSQDITMFIDPTLTLYYTDCDGNPGPTQYDLVTTVLHELTHGLGFGPFGNLTVNSNYGLRLREYERRLTYPAGNPTRPWAQVPLISVATADAAAVSDNLFYTGVHYLDTKIFAPTDITSPSSIGHLDDNTYSGTINDLMTPYATNGKSNHALGPLACDVLLSQGYRVDASLCQLPNTNVYPVNDDCPAAIQLVPGQRTVGSNVLANSVVPTLAPACASTLRLQNVWYMINTGVYSRLSATLCDQATEFDSRLALYSGTCDSLSCIGISEGDSLSNPCTIATASPPGGSSLITRVLVTPHSDYYLEVSAQLPYYNGNFGLTVTLSDPENDDCTEAIALVSGTKTIGGLVGANFDDVVTAACQQGQPPIEVWYTFTTGSTDNVATISTCFPETDTDTQISVFENDCDGLICFPSSPTTCGLGFGSIISNLAVFPGTTYTVLVGRSSASGSFAIMVSLGTQVPAPPNDNCAAATSLTTGIVSTGTVMGATDDRTNLVDDCGTESSNNVWFSFFSGTFSLVDIVTCNTTMDFNSKVFLYAGSCGALVCVDSGNAGSFCGTGTISSALTQQINPGRNYFIMVSGGSASDSGSFTITINLSSAGTGGDPYVTLFNGAKLKIPRDFDEKDLSLYHDYELQVNFQSTRPYAAVSVITTIAATFTVDGVRHSLEAVVEDNLPVFYLDQQAVGLNSETIPSWLIIENPKQYTGILAEFERYHTVALTVNGRFIIVGGQYNRRRQFGFFNIQILRNDDSIETRNEIGLTQFRGNSLRDGLDFSAFVRSSSWA